MVARWKEGYKIIDCMRPDAYIASDVKNVKGLTGTRKKDKAFFTRGVLQ
jgi:hypothetical protein